MTTPTEALKLVMDYPDVRTYLGRQVSDVADAAIAQSEQPATDYERRNPLGGPAKLFDAVADMIRAGEPVDAAMAEFGLAWAEQTAEQAQAVAWRARLAVPEDCMQHVYSENPKALAYLGVPVLPVFAAPPAAQPQPATFDAEGFRAWVLTNLPDDTIIGSGKWWADHLTAWARRFVKGDAPPAAQPLTNEQFAKIVLRVVYDEDEAIPHRQQWAHDIGEPFARAVIAEFCRVNGIGTKPAGEQS